MKVRHVCFFVVKKKSESKSLRNVKCTFVVKIMQSGPHYIFGSELLKTVDSAVIVFFIQMFNFVTEFLFVCV